MSPRYWLREIANHRFVLPWSSQKTRKGKALSTNNAKCMGELLLLGLLSIVGTSIIAIVS